MTTKETGMYVRHQLARTPYVTLQSYQENKNKRKLFRIFIIQKPTIHSPFQKKPCLDCKEGFFAMQTRLL